MLGAVTAVPVRLVNRNRTNTHTQTHLQTVQTIHISECVYDSLAFGAHVPSPIFVPSIVL